MGVSFLVSSSTQSRISRLSLTLQMGGMEGFIQGKSSAGEGSRFALMLRQLGCLEEGGEREGDRGGGQGVCRGNAHSTQCSGKRKKGRGKGEEKVAQVDGLFK
jgi:hypothetical protein